jgi:sulfide dehydrogenase cytochrome subunit
MSRPPFPAGGAACAALLVLAASSGAGRAEPAPPGAASCRACHGPETDGAYADLGSLSARAIEEALAAYRSGARAGTVMPRIARGFSADEARALARALGRDPEPEEAAR